MPRQRVTVKRETLADPQFGDRLVSKLIGLMMREGKRSIAEKICYESFALIKQKSGLEPLKVFRNAVENVKPAVEVKSRRVGGASYQVPVEVRSNRRASLALRWLTSYAKQRSGRSMEEKLAAELIDASNNTGGAIKKRDDTHKMAEANKAFAHYRW